MDAICYLDKCKSKLDIKSSYALSKALNIKENVMSLYYKGKAIPDEYACFRIGEILEVDPAIVIAEIRASGEKNPEKREYFKTFRGACGKAAAGIMLALALSVFYANAPVDGVSRALEGAAAVTAAVLFYYRRYFA